MQCLSGTTRWINIHYQDTLVTKVNKYQSLIILLRNACNLVMYFEYVDDYLCLVNIAMFPFIYVYVFPFRTTLCNAEVIHFLDARVILWGCSTNKPEGYRGV